MFLEVFLDKGVQKICSKFTGEHPCRSPVSFATLLKSHFGMGCNFVEITLRHGLQLYWNRTSACVFSCKFAAYFQNTFSYKNFWMTASEFICDAVLFSIIPLYFLRFWRNASLEPACLLLGLYFFLFSS